MTQVQKASGSSETLVAIMQHIGCDWMPYMQDLPMMLFNLQTELAVLSMVPVLKTSSSATMHVAADMQKLSLSW